MARKPNYSFERNQRARAKSAKQELKREARAGAKAAAARGGVVDQPIDGEPGAEAEHRTADGAGGDVADSA